MIRSYLTTQRKQILIRAEKLILPVVNNFRSSYLTSRSCAREYCNQHIIMNLDIMLQFYRKLYFGTSQ